MKTRWIAVVICLMAVACGRPARGPVGSEGASVSGEPAEGKALLSAARLSFAGADRRNPYLPTLSAEAAGASSDESPALLGEGELLSFDRVVPVQEGGASDDDALEAENAELPAHASDRFLVWNDVSAGRKITDAAYSFEIRDARNALVSSSPRQLVGYDERGARWFIPLRSLAPHGVSAANPAETVWLTLELELAGEGSASAVRVKPRIALRMSGRVPELRIETSEVPASSLLDARALGAQARASGVPILVERFSNTARRELKLWARAEARRLEFSTAVLFTDYIQGGVPAGQQDPEILERGSQYQSAIGAEIGLVEIVRRGVDARGKPEGTAQTEVISVPPGGQVFPVKVGARQQLTLKWLARPAAARTCALPAAVERQFSWQVSRIVIDYVVSFFARIPVSRVVVENRSATRTAAWSLGGAGIYGIWQRGLVLKEVTDDPPAVLEFDEKPGNLSVRSGSVERGLPQHGCSGLF